MPKHEFLTPKAIANRIKSKGLQKLRWYCQMCQKQCRDENGFKCHTTSESHQRQLLLFAENPEKYIDSFSKEFEDSFLELLSRRFGTKRVHANQVYQEFITDRNHLHMNATMWETLTEFVKFLGRDGKCIVDQTEKGWFITYIDRDPEAIRRQEQLAKKEKLEMDDEEKMSQFIQKQVKRAKKTASTKISEPVYTELKRVNEEEKFVINLSVTKKKETAQATPLKILEKNSLAMTKKKETFRDDISVASNNSSKSGEKRKCALEEIMEEEERQKEKLLRKNYWLARDIVVKVITKKLGERYYKKKAVVKDVQDYYTGIIKMLDSGDIVKMDQTHLETVIPAQGKLVTVVNGAYRGCEAILVSLNEHNFSVRIKINSGLTKGRIIEGVKYEDVCKKHIPS